MIAALYITTNMLQKLMALLTSDAETAKAYLLFHGRAHTAYLLHYVCIGILHCQIVTRLGHTVTQAKMSPRLVLTCMRRSV